MSRKNLISQVESLLRQDQTDLALKALDSVEFSKLDDDHKLSFATLLRRSGKAELGLRLLSPLISGYANPHIDGPEELIEYCMCLRNIGAIEESEIRLQQLEIDRSPSALFCALINAANQWDSARALQIADLYINRFGDENPYQSVTVQINRAQAYLGVDQLDDAISQLQELIPVLQIQQWHRLLSNAHVLMAQVFIQKTEFDRAEKHLEFARGISQSPRPKEDLFQQRWKAVISARKSGEREPLQKVKELAKKLGHSETIRSIDMELLRLNFQQGAFDHLYFGSPFAGYRQFLVRELGEPSDFYVLNSEAQNDIALSEALRNGEEFVRPGQKTHLLLIALLSDFYRPVNVGKIFSSVFSNEYFDGEKSPKRVHQLVYRTRQLLQELGMGIDEADGIYRWNHDQHSVRVEKVWSQSIYEHELNQLQKIFSAGQEFSSHQVEESRSLSAAKAYRVLHFGLSSGKLQRKGLGNQTRYFFH